MSYGFIIGIIKSLELNFDLVYIDECGFQIQNNNLRYWRKENDEIYGETKTNNKSKINLILAINKKEILLGHLYKNETIGSNEFLDFIINLIDLIGDDKINNTIFILDNASYHLSKQIKEYIKKNKIKFLFNVPYKSNFNAIEMCFHFFKNKIYKEIFNNINSLEKRINNLINDDEINNNMEKIYLKTLEIYKAFYINNIDKVTLMAQNKNFLSKKKKK